MTSAIDEFQAKVPDKSIRMKFHRRCLQHGSCRARLPHHGSVRYGRSIRYLLVVQWAMRSRGWSGFNNPIPTQPINTRHTPHCPWQVNTQVRVLVIDSIHVSPTSKYRQPSGSRYLVACHHVSWKRIIWYHETSKCRKPYNENARRIISYFCFWSISPSLKYPQILLRIRHLKNSI